MTRTAILSDIHGNLPALEAVLADARGQSIDRYVLLGDYVFDLPWSNEVCQALMALPLKMRVPLELHYIEGYSVAETARILAVPEGTVKWRLSKGRALLKDALNGKEARI